MGKRNSKVPEKIFAKTNTKKEILAKNKFTFCAFKAHLLLTPASTEANINILYPIVKVKN